jgi:hypothetical protein
VVGLTLALTLLTALLLFSPRPNPRRQFLLSMIGLGLVFTSVVEVIVLKGDISRMNTVFKFYLQVWVFGSGISGFQPATWLNIILDRNLPSPKLKRRLVNDGRTVVGPVCFWLHASIPMTATVRLWPSRTVPPVIDGTAFMQTSLLRLAGCLNWDRQAFSG